jgi:hypothetical protein
MVRRLFIAVLLILFCSEGIYSVAYAGSAEVLPKGVSRGKVVTTHFFPIEEKFDEHGNIEEIAEIYNVGLGSNIFPNLGLVEAAFGMPAGSANLGRSSVDMEFQFDTINFTFDHGITDKLTVGIDIPYYKARNKVDASLDTSAATVGKSAIGAGFGAPIVPLAGGGPFGDAVPLTREDLINLISGGIDVNGDGIIDVAGFGYRRFRTWSGEGLGDIKAGLKYQYLKTKSWRLAGTLGARFPTGKLDDPDSLTDWLPENSGTYSVLFRQSSDFTGIKNHVLNLSLGYHLILPSKEELRVLRDANVAISANKERVKRDIGDVYEIEVSDKYTPLKGCNFSLAYNFKKHKKDRVSGDLGFAYNALEKESDLKGHLIKVGASYSTVPLYREKKFPIPLSIDFEYRNRVDGKNNYTRSHYVRLGVSIFF